MADEIKEQIVEQTEDVDFDPVKEIQDLRNNTVSKEDYEKVVAENKRYLKALIDGQQVKSAAERERLQKK